MDVTFLGVGEAFDPDEANASVLVEASGFSLLIDCGPSTVPALWRLCPEPDALDAIYLTHHHIDHVAGLLPVFDRWGALGRGRPISIFTTEEGIGQLRALFTAAFITWDAQSPFPVRFEVAQQTHAIGPFATTYAPTLHAVPTHAIRIEHAGQSLCYSGDGRPTPESMALYAGTDVLLHECYLPDAAPQQRYHCDLPTLRTIADVGRIGLYHIQAGQRPAMRQAIADEPRLFVPDAGTTLRV